MKKNILLIAVALFMFLGNQSVNAQTKTKADVNQTSSSEMLESKVMKKTTHLVRPLGLNKTQKEKVYTLFLMAEEKLMTSEGSLDSKKKSILKSKIQKEVMGAMKDILNEDQFKKYLDIAEKL